MGSIKLSSILAEARKKQEEATEEPLVRDPGLKLKKSTFKGKDVAVWQPQQDLLCVYAKDDEDNTVKLAIDMKKKIGGFYPVSIGGLILYVEPDAVQPLMDTLSGSTEEDVY